MVQINEGYLNSSDRVIGYMYQKCEKPQFQCLIFVFTRQPENTCSDSGKLPTFEAAFIRAGRKTVFGTKKLPPVLMLYS